MARTKQIAKTGEAPPRIRGGRPFFGDDNPPPTLRYAAPERNDAGEVIIPARLTLELPSDSVWAVDTTREREGRFGSRRVPSPLHATARLVGMTPFFPGDKADLEYVKRESFGDNSLLGIEVSEEQTKVVESSKHYAVLKIRRIEDTSPFSLKVHNGKRLGNIEVLPQAQAYALLPTGRFDLVNIGENLQAELKRSDFDLSAWLLVPLLDKGFDENNPSPMRAYFAQVGEAALAADSFTQLRAAAYESAWVSLPKAQRDGAPRTAPQCFFLCRWGKPPGATQAQLVGAVIRIRQRGRVTPAPGLFKGRLPIFMTTPFYVQRRMPIAGEQMDENTYFRLGAEFFARQAIIERFPNSDTAAKAEEEIREAIDNFAAILLGYVGQRRVVQREGMFDADSDDLLEDLGRIQDSEVRMGYDVQTSDIFGDDAAPILTSSRLMSLAKKWQRRAIRELEALIETDRKYALFTTTVKDPIFGDVPVTGSSIRALKALAFQVSRRLAFALDQSLRIGEYFAPQTVPVGDVKVRVDAPVRSFTLYRSYILFQKLLAAQQESRGVKEVVGEQIEETIKAREFRDRAVTIDPTIGLLKRAALESLRDKGVKGWVESMVETAEAQKDVSVRVRYEDALKEYRMDRTPPPVVDRTIKPLADRGSIRDWRGPVLTKGWKPKPKPD